MRAVGSSVRTTGHALLFLILFGFFLHAAARPAAAQTPTPTPGGDCCNPHTGPSCDDSTCSSCVCDLDPLCCTAGEPWDDICAAEANDNCANDCPCGPPPNATPTPGGDCCAVHAGTGCDTTACEACVCGMDALCCSLVWDEQCVSRGQKECIDSCPCEALPTETPEPTPTPGGDCCAPHNGSSCDDDTCQACVCDLDSDCCSLLWDSRCVQEATEDCAASCTCDAAGDCCAVHEGVGCVDNSCQACVCNADDFCCADGWDQSCVDVAGSECAGSCSCEVAGDCCTPNDGLGCREETCEDCVCAGDPTCCNELWDQFCVDRANAECAANCSCDVADCCSGHGGLGCDELRCQQCVCGQDEPCCTEEWDDQCAEEALNECATRCACDELSNCCRGRPDDPGGCDDAFCEACVCDVDDFCCNDTWDPSCANIAMVECAFSCTCVDPCVGDCNSDGLVRVDELVAAVNIAIGDGNVNDCQAADVNIDDEVSIDELISSVGSALTGCQLP